MEIESISSFSIPVSIYLVMGIIICRIQLDKSNTHGYRWLQWLQFGVDVLRIIFMWPLVLFIEKSQNWLEKTTPVEELNPINEFLANSTNEVSK